MLPQLVPQYFRAAPAHARGFPRIERAVPRGIQSSPQGSSAEILAAFQANARLLDNPSILEVTLEKKGTTWPDFIGHQAWSGPLLASEKVCETLAREEVRGFELVPAEFVDPLPDKLNRIGSPRYFAIKPMAEARYRVTVSYLQDGVFQPRGSFILPDEKTNVPKDEEGVCKIHEPEGLDCSGNLIFGNVPEGFGCDRHVAELAFRERWTNLQFRAFDAPYLPRMSTPTAPRILCSTGQITDAWYTPLQMDALRQKAPTDQPRGFWGRFFRIR